MTSIHKKSKNKIKLHNKQTYRQAKCKINKTKATTYLHNLLNAWFNSMLRIVTCAKCIQFTYNETNSLCTTHCQSTTLKKTQKTKQTISEMNNNHWIHWNNSPFITPNQIHYQTSTFLQKTGKKKNNEDWNTSNVQTI